MKDKMNSTLYPPKGNNSESITQEESEIDKRRKLSVEEIVTCSSMLGLNQCFRFLSAANRSEKDRTRKIDKILEEEGKRYIRECKILLLGSGESGKSTIVKQMRIIHLDGYNIGELQLFKPVILKNVIQSVKNLIYGYNSLDLAPNSYKAQEFMLNYAELLNDFGFRGTFSQEFLEGLIELVQDPVTQQCLDKSGEFYILDSAAYFFEHINRIGLPEYVPTVEDVLRSRSQTTGIIETRFTMGQLNIHMFDVGGQRSERKKWIHCFEAVTSIIFCVALSEYDQNLLEQKDQNRLMESIMLFESVINSRWFIRTSILLFLNKIDLFRKKLPKSRLEKYFPDYTGGQDINKAAKYILWRFTQTNHAKLVIYPHLTQATDTSNIRLVFAAVKETILQNALKDSGIL